MKLHFLSNTKGRRKLMWRELKSTARCHNNFFSHLSITQIKKMMVIGIAKWQTRWKRAREMFDKKQSSVTFLLLIYSCYSLSTFFLINILWDLYASYFRNEKGFNYFSTFILYCSTLLYLLPYHKNVLRRFSFEYFFLLLFIIRLVSLKKETHSSGILN